MKRVGFVYGRSSLNSAPLRFMPFSSNTIHKLVEEGLIVDLFITEDRNDEYSKIFPKQVNITFLDSKYLWQREGTINYFLLKFYWRLIILFNFRKYCVVFGCGQTGNTLGHVLAKTKRCPFVYLNDEFPDTNPYQKWINAEKKAAQSADVIIVPDEKRYDILKNQVSIDQIPWFTLANSPLLKSNDSKKFDVTEKFKIPSDKLYVLQAGGIFDFNQITESMFTVNQWPIDMCLIINSPSGIRSNLRQYGHLIVPERIYWNTIPLTNEELMFLKETSVACFGLYRNENDNLLVVGKSSGKVMKSIAAGTPVIVSKNCGFEFVEEHQLGVVINHPSEIPHALETIIANLSFYRANCKNYFLREGNFDYYWEKFSGHMKKWISHEA